MTSCWHFYIVNVNGKSVLNRLLGNDSNGRPPWYLNSDPRDEKITHVVCSRFWPKCALVSCQGNFFLVGGTLLTYRYWSAPPGASLSPIFLQFGDIEGLKMGQTKLFCPIMSKGRLNLLAKYVKCKKLIKNKKTFFFSGIQHIEIGFAVQPYFPIDPWSLLKGI